jgi:hypothetical protein
MIAIRTTRAVKKFQSLELDGEKSSKLWNFFEGQLPSFGSFFRAMSP